MKNTISFKILTLFLCILIASSCSKTENIPNDIKINDFVWRGMNAYYLWQPNVPNLSDRQFSNREQLNNYLASYTSPDALFYDVLYYPEEYPQDPNRTFSWIVDDYIALENSFQAIRETTGLRIEREFYADGSNNVYMVITDIISGSSAETNGLTRGMIFTEVDGVQLTINNYADLLSADNFTITLADYNAGVPIANGTIVSLTRSQIQDNPVKIFDVVHEDAGNKIGYLLYNQFSTSFDDELNAAFAYFKSEAVTGLIVDLRYNGGGAVASAIYLGSMITGQYNGELFSQEVWNPKVMENVDNNIFLSYFTDEIDNDIVKEPINSLNLPRVYFIVSGSSASASELVINALSAYIDVTLVGTQTYGKHVGSITLYDSDNFLKNGPNFNTSHAWALQPIVLEIQNKNGENNPEGFSVDVEIEEDPNNLGILGVASGPDAEPLLERTIQYILTGAKPTLGRKASRKNKPLWNSNMLYPDYNNMYVELK
ncbi:S41 family peptidase [Tenacibaculum sp. IB213877]|uniref:S41 family peptidase n=1 Tax=Tenacibaculum sp. IB213877 TaxID=3097351 RepID=UPI002A5AA46D|nr:S41 family peptidase [Tenacibaculum sp. IB213877]MDY0779673.1 S41 family peptidase [Tenacibaculum sp. IB213877]